MKNNKYELQFAKTQENLDKKGKTNKKLKRNQKAQKYLTKVGKELKEKAEVYLKATFKKGRRYSVKGENRE